MKHLLLIVLALSVLSGAQTKTAPKKTGSATQQKPAETKPPAAPTQPATTPAPVELRPESVVITINGVCAANTPPEKCQLTVSKTEFDRLIKIVNPELPKEKWRELAGLLVQIFAMSNEALKAGLDRDPDISQRLQVERLRQLAEAYGDRLRAGYKPTDQEVETAYAENKDRYEEFQVRAIFVPKSIGTAIELEKTKAVAEQIHTRAAAGEDFDTLQIDAYKLTQQTAAPPKTDLGFRGRGRLGPHEADILPLKAGQVTAVREAPQSYVIYRVEAKRLVPLADAKVELENYLVSQKYSERLNQMLTSIKTDLSADYFGPPEPPAQPQSAQPAAPAPEKPKN
ncbi:MAG: peptidyl-prolyl cis-trans isomerase [Acidobacteriales bacterium]|nr:peptidyl-prolyl cis-trans isomerase [Terriglobales bacterium]